MQRHFCSCAAGCSQKARAFSLTYGRPAKPQRLWDPDSALKSPQGLEFIVLVQLPLDIAYLENRPASKLPIVAFPNIPHMSRGRSKTCGSVARHRWRKSASR
jgi:hypothetical protein